MKLTSFEIQNHSRLQDTSISVRDHLVLVGPNDVGKSSLIRCLDLLLGASVAQLYSQLSVEDFRRPDAPLIIEAVLTGFNDSEKALFADEIKVDPASGVQSLRIRLEAVTEDHETLSIRRTGPDGGTGRQLSRDQLAGLAWKMIGAVASTRDLRDDRRGTVDEIMRAVDLGSEKEDFDAVVTRLEKLLGDSAALGDLRGQLAAQLTRALPEKLSRDDLAFVPGATATSDVLSDVRLQINRNGTPRNLTEQSDGMRALFAIALYDLVSESANIVAIDEPEIHLHPTSQRSLARLLRNGQNQKILATHSPDIVGAFPPESVVSVRPGGKLVQPQPGFLAGKERMLVHWWSRDKLEPLTAARVIAVEGVSDRIILEKAADLTGRNLDRLGVAVIQTDGAGDMAPIVSLFGSDGFQVPMSLLIDVDAKATTARKLGVTEGDLAANSVWISDPDLEGEYVAALGASVVWNTLATCGLFSQNELNICSPTGSNGTRTDTDVAAFCGLKSSFKVRAAMAVANVLTPEISRRIGSVQSLLNEFAPEP